MKPLLLIFCISHLFQSGYAQSHSPGDNTSYRSAIDSTITFFYTNSRSVCACFNGKEYIPPPYSFSEGSPWFLASEARNGTIVYDHVYYDGVHLLYDELQNDLVFVDESHRIMLLNEKVERFSILGNQFVNIVQPSPIKADKPAGFFQLLYEGNYMLLKKDEKKIRELNSFSAEEKVRVIDTRPVYYLRKGDDFIRIDGKATFFEVWGKHKKEIKEFIKHNRIKFTTDPDNDFAKVTAFCDQLN